MYKTIHKIYGADGHRQAASFQPSYVLHCTERGALLTLAAQDVTGSNDFVILSITAPTLDDCRRELEGQLSDGIFENCRVGRVELIRRGEVLTCD